MSTIHGFELVREQDVPEINSRTRLFRHVKTGAELLSVENQDENKCFGVAFTTPPTSSNGIAHILEHSVLCGSRKYPSKEPFVELLKGSLASFVNAITFSDKTIYPVASQNLQDFYNLVDVYLDAVFYPRITPDVLKQEGWHYELDAPNQPLTYKGVVFNEMKGAYSSPDNLLYRYTRQATFPDTTYGVDSGGDPEVIPTLTYDEFKRFHETLYHPSNARVYFYGDDDPDERLRLMDEYLSGFDRLDVDARIQLQPRFDEPRRVVFPYHPGDDASKEYITVSWALPEPHDTELNLAFSILSHILTGTSAAPLRKALTESGLGEDVIGGFDSGLRQMMYTTGMKGVPVGKAEQVETLVLDTLRELAENGIAPEAVEASMNTVEFNLREYNTGQLPRGLMMMVSSLSTWLYGGDPVAPLAFEAPLTAIKDRLAAGERVFEDLIARYLLDNAHRSTVLLKPDVELQARLNAREEDRLAQAREAMTEDDLQRVIEDTQRLRELQERPDSPEDLAKIPTLTLADLDRNIRTYPIDVSQMQDARLLYHDLFTNGVFYLDLGFNLMALPQEYLPYVTLFSRALLEMGTEQEDFVTLSQRIGRKTGGIRPSTLTSQVRESADSAAWLFLRAKSTPDRVEDLLDILRDVLLTAKFDNRERFRQIVLEEKAGAEASLAPSGHIVVARRLSARFNAADWSAEQMNGVSYLLFLRNLLTKIDNDWPQVLHYLENMRSYLVNQQAMLCNVTIDGDNWNGIQPRLDSFLSALPSTVANWQDWSLTRSDNNEGLTIPAQVNYVGKGASLYDLGYKLHGSTKVIVNYLSMSWLWNRLRVQGGAYGGFARFDANSGVMLYLSYRDPNLLKTVENYDNTGRFLRELDLSDAELTKAVIGAIGDMDRYLLPDAKGYTSMVHYLTGITDDKRQQFRDEVLATSQADFRAFADVLDQVRDSGKLVVMGSRDAIDKANAAQPELLQVVPVL